MACREHLDLSVNNCRERAKPATRVALNNRAGKASRVRIQVRGATFFFCVRVAVRRTVRRFRSDPRTTVAGAVVYGILQPPAGCCFSIVTCLAEISMKPGSTTVPLGTTSGRVLGSW